MSNRKKARGEAPQRSRLPRLWPMLALNSFMADFQVGFAPVLKPACDKPGAASRA